MVFLAPGFRQLPKTRQARALGLALAQASLGWVAPALRASVPAPVWRALGRAGAPVRLAPPSRHATLDPVLAAAELQRAGARIERVREPEVSIVVPTAGAVEWLAAALASIAAYTQGVRYEVIVVDDASPDRVRVERAIERHPGVTAFVNATAHGFAASVNRGARAARGKSLVVLNDDVFVTPGWLEGLVRVKAAKARVAWVGPVSNDTGDGATIPARYRDLNELLAFAGTQRGAPRAMDKLALHAALLDRARFEAVGGLDEGYVRGMFEDDDLALALRARGGRLFVAPDVYVHHAAGATFRALSPFEYFACFELNRRRFEERWHVRWRVREGGEP